MKRSLVHSNKLTNQSTRTQQAAPVFEALCDQPNEGILLCGKNLEKRLSKYVI